MPCLGLWQTAKTNQNQKMMKTKIYYTGLIAALLMFLGVLFKMQHWPGASILLTVGTFTLLFLFLPFALRNSYKSEGGSGSGPLYVVTWITSLVILGSMLFKIQHWPGAGYMLLVALPFPYVVFLPVYLIVTGKNKNHNIYNTVAILFLLASFSALSALLALGVSKEKLDDSLLISGNYNRTETALATLPVNEASSALTMKIDEALTILDEYEEARLQGMGNSRREWVENPESVIGITLRQPGTVKYAGRVDLLYADLQSALSDIIATAKGDPAHKPLADNIAAILNMQKSSGEGYYIADQLFRSNLQPWVFVYLDGLRVNLMMMRITVE
jgi:hypothetical protein